MLRLYRAPWVTRGAERLEAYHGRFTARPKTGSGLICVQADVAIVVGDLSFTKAK